MIINNKQKTENSKKFHHPVSKNNHNNNIKKQGKTYFIHEWKWRGKEKKHITQLNCQRDDAPQYLQFHMT